MGQVCSASLWQIQLVKFGVRGGAGLGWAKGRRVACMEGRQSKGGRLEGTIHRSRKLVANIKLRECINAIQYNTVTSEL